MSASFDLEQHPSVTVVILKGRLDASGAGTIRGEVTALPETQAYLVFDLQQLEWIDSSGVGVLVSVYKRARTQGGEVMVCQLQGQPKEIFRLLRLDAAFTLCADREQAVAALTERAQNRAG